MKLSESLSGLEPAKARFVQSLAGRLLAVDGVVSVTFPGSFIEQRGLAGISDIDVVVILRALSRPGFEACRAAALAASPTELGLSGHRVVLNDSFGPLKFDEPGVVVIHLMIYDVPGHRGHVLKSPFTCLDWERSTCHFGLSLRQVFPVLPLQPRQFLDARRSLGNYLSDLAAGAISYRRYRFDRDAVHEEEAALPLDARHQGEYAFHIVRNLVGNYAKLVRRANRPLDDTEFADFWRQELPGCARHASWFEALRAIKRARRSDFPGDSVERTREFLGDFGRELEDTWHRRAIRHVFVRHGRTALNDGSFLGQRRDPPVAEMPGRLASAPSRVVSSPALRCRQTAAALADPAEVIVDERLREIDYGEAEGLTPTGLAERFPAVPAGWDRGEDPAFPGGENTADVANRLRSFLRDLPGEPTLVVTHNVTLRCLLGSLLDLPPRHWHRLPVPHLASIEVCVLDGIPYLDLAGSQIAALSDALVGHLA